MSADDIFQICVQNICNVFELSGVAFRLAPSNGGLLVHTFYIKREVSEEPLAQTVGRGDGGSYNSRSNFSRSLIRNPCLITV